MVQQTNRSRAGGDIHVPFPTKSQVHVEDVAHRLSNICRFTGATRSFFSVAQHSMEVMRLCAAEAPRFGVDPARAAMCGLLHDAKESYINDVIPPLKSCLGATFRKIDDDVGATCDEALGVTEWMRETRECWRWADLEMVISDAARWDCFGTYDLGPHGVIEIHTRNVVPPPFRLRFGSSRALPPGQAALGFLTCYRELRDQLSGVH